MSSLATLIPYGVLLSHLILAIFVLALIFKKSWGKDLIEILGKQALVLGFLVTLGAVVGSLFYSNVVGYEPCSLCWWQRVLIYPQLILFLTALKYKDRSVFRYAWRLSLLAAIIAIYQYYAAVLGGHSLLPCTEAGAACSKVYVKAFGYITIELMSLTVSLYVLILSYINKLYQSK